MPEYSEQFIEMRKTVIALLDDDSGNGISEAAYDQLVTTIDLIFPNDDFTDIWAEVQTAKNRVYLLEDHGLKEIPEPL